MFDRQPTLRGALVEARPLRSADFADLYAVAADPRIWEQHPARDRHEEAVFRRFFDEALASGGALLVRDVATGRVIGSSRFHGYSAEQSEVEIGWTFLARSHWGGRHNGELKRLMLGHAFRFVNSVVFLIHPGNLRSQIACERIGGVRQPEPDAEGRLVFRITAADFASIRAMSIADYDAVHALWLATPGVGLSESDTRAGTEAFLRRNPGMSAVAYAGGDRTSTAEQCGPRVTAEQCGPRLVGAVLCGHDGRRGYLHHLAVATAWRGRGIARQLVARCFEQLAAAGIPKCNIFLYADNAEGAAFWLHDGWSPREDLRVLQKPIPPVR